MGGTLYADEIVTKHGKFGDLLANQITTSTINNIVQPEPTATPTPTVEPTPSEGLTGLHPVTTVTPEASDSALLAEVQTWEITDPSQDLKITSNLKVLGRTSLADTTVAGQLMVDASITISESGINSLTGPLYLNSLGLGGVDILAGKVVITQSGDVSIQGNLAIGGEISAAKLTLNQKEESGFGKLLTMVNKEGQEVAYITKEGEGAFTKLAIIAGGEATASAKIGENEVQTNATAGKAVLKAGLTELTIHSSAITDQTLIYVTPISNTQNKVLFVKAKKAGDYFTVAIDTAINSDIEFNYWLINYLDFFRFS